MLRIRTRSAGPAVGPALTYGKAVVLATTRIIAQRADFLQFRSKRPILRPARNLKETGRFVPTWVRRRGQGPRRRSKEPHVRKRRPTREGPRRECPGREGSTRSGGRRGQRYGAGDAALLVLLAFELAALFGIELGLLPFSRPPLSRLPLSPMGATPCHSEMRPGQTQASPAPLGDLNTQPLREERAGVFERGEDHLRLLMISPECGLLTSAAAGAEGW